MTNPYESRRPTPQLRRAGCFWVVALVTLVIGGFVMRMVFADEAWLKPVSTVVSVLTAVVLIGSLRTSLKIHREVNRKDG